MIYKFIQLSFATLANKTILFFLTMDGITKSPLRFGLHTMSKHKTLTSLVVGNITDHKWSTYTFMNKAVQKVGSQSS